MQQVERILLSREQLLVRDRGLCRTHRVDTPRMLLLLRVLRNERRRMCRSPVPNPPDTSVRGTVLLPQDGVLGNVRRADYARRCRSLAQERQVSRQALASCSEARPRDAGHLGASRGAAASHRAGLPRQ
mgnify:CR=1 FL=1